MHQMRWHYWFGFIFDALMVIALVYVAVLYEATLLEGALTMIGGIVLFSFIEYFVHAKFFHGWIKSFEAEHSKYHRNPRGCDAVPFYFAVVVISPIYLVSFFVMPLAYASLFTAGIFVGFSLYGMMHHVILRSSHSNPYFSFMVRFHDLHHKEPMKNYGVIVPFWDMLFGTYLAVKK